MKARVGCQMLQGALQAALSPRPLPLGGEVLLDLDGTGRSLIHGFGATAAVEAALSGVSGILRLRVPGQKILSFLQVAAEGEQCLLEVVPGPKLRLRAGQLEAKLPLVKELRAEHYPTAPPPEGLGIEISGECLEWAKTVLRITGRHEVSAWVEKITAAIRIEQGRMECWTTDGAWLVRIDGPREGWGSLVANLSYHDAFCLLSGLSGDTIRVHQDRSKTWWRTAGETVHLRGQERAVGVEQLAPVEAGLRELKAPPATLQAEEVKELARQVKSLIALAGPEALVRLALSDRLLTVAALSDEASATWQLEGVEVPAGTVIGFTTKGRAGYLVAALEELAKSDCPVSFGQAVTKEALRLERPGMLVLAMPVHDPAGGR